MIYTKLGLLSDACRIYWGYRAYAEANDEHLNGDATSQRVVTLHKLTYLFTRPMGSITC